MSDRPSDIEFKLKHILTAVKDVATEWYELGLQLDLPDSDLKLIDSNPVTGGHLRMMLSKWLDYDPEASWDKLADALNAMGKNAIAANIRTKCMRAVSETITEDSRNPVPDQEETKARQEMTLTVMRKIKRQFASLQVEVRSAVEARKVKVSDVHQFLVSFFQSECCIPEAPDLTKLFNIITEAKLWCFDNYGPLKELAEAFLPDDQNPARKLVSKYKDQLSGFYVATKIVDFIDLSDFDDSDDDSDCDSEDDTQQSLSPKEYKKLYRKLKVTLKLDRTTKFSDLTMNYVDTLWKALIEEFNLPPLTAVIKKIVPGSLIITWLVPPQVSTVIAVSYSKALRFYQQHNIVKVELDDRTLYDEEWIIGSTPLYQVSFMGNADEVKEILKGGADVNEQNTNELGETALFGACRGSHVETTRILLDHGINMDCQNKEGQSALWCASDAGETECVKVLVKYGAQVDLSDMDGDTALIEACRCGHVETARVLLDHGANVDHQNKYGQSALWCASSAGETECVKELVKYGAQVDLPDEDGNTALIQACRDGHVEQARVLLDHGANVDHQNNKEETALNLACFEGESETVRLLLKAGAKTDIQDKYGYTALFWAAYEGHANVIQVFIDCGTAVDIRDNKDGRTALMVASSNGKVDAVKLLLEAKADPNITDEDGETALHKAALRGHVEVVKEMVKYGAAVDIRNKEGLTALDMARGGGPQAVCEVLEQYTKQETRSELTEGQRESFYQRLLKMAERVFLKEQVKKREEQQQKEHHHQREERVRGEREKRSLRNRFRGRRNRPEQIIGTIPAPEK